MSISPWNHCFFHALILDSFPGLKDIIWATPKLTNIHKRRTRNYTVLLMWKKIICVLPGLAWVESFSSQIIIRTLTPSAALAFNSSPTLDSPSEKWSTQNSITSGGGHIKILNNFSYYNTKLQFGLWNPDNTSIESLSGLPDLVIRNCLIKKTLQIV